jgi:hypothetical protein
VRLIQIQEGESERLKICERILHTGAKFRSERLDASVTGGIIGVLRYLRIRKAEIWYHLVHFGSLYIHIKYVG